MINRIGRFLTIHLGLMLCLLLKAEGQVSPTQQGSKLPPFEMLLTNGSSFATTALNKNRPLVLIYFAPGCDHCLTLMRAFFKNVQQFKGAEVLMVTFTSLKEVASFEKAFQTAKYPNIKAGLEKRPLFLQAYYKLQHTPFTALYDKQGKLVASYKQEERVADLIRSMKQLK